MSGLHIEYGFIAFPQAIVDDGLDLSLGEYRLLGYLLRHRFRVKSEVFRVRQDELLRGIFKADGSRLDRGCGITSGRDLRVAREALERRGWLAVETLPDGVLSYELCLQGDGRGEPVSGPGAKCTHEGAGAFCSICGCKMSRLRVQNAPSYKEEKVKKREVIQKPSAADAPAALMLVSPTGSQRKAADVRHVPCRDACKGYAMTHGVEPAWGPAAATQLKLLLDASPGLTVERFTLWLRNRGSSAGVAHGEPPQVWLATLGKYDQGPLDRFGKLEAGNGTSIERHGTAGFSSGGGHHTKTGGNWRAAQNVLAAFERADAGGADGFERVG